MKLRSYYVLLSGDAASSAARYAVIRRVNIADLRSAPLTARRQSLETRIYTQNAIIHRHRHAGAQPTGEPQGRSARRVVRRVTTVRTGAWALLPVVQCSPAHAYEHRGSIRGAARSQEKHARIMTAPCRLARRRSRVCQAVRTATCARYRRHERRGACDTRISTTHLRPPTAVSLAAAQLIDRLGSWNPTVTCPRGAWRWSLSR